MLSFPRAQVLPIGLDIGHDNIKMMQLERQGESLSVWAAASAPLPIEAQANPGRHLPLAAETIRQMLRRGRFHGRKIVAALPQRMLHIRNLRLPQGNSADPENIRSEAKAILRVDAAESQIQFLKAGEARDAGAICDEIIVLAALHKDVAAFMDMLSRAGVELAALDSQPCALYRLVDRFMRRRDDEQDAHALVDIGRYQSVVVIGRGRQISLIKAIEVGGHHFQKAVSRRLGITLDESRALRHRLMEPSERGAAADSRDREERDPVRQAAADASRSAMEELGREIALCLRYHAVTFRGRRPACVQLIGGEAADPQLRFVLNKILPIPSEVAQPLQSVNTEAMTAGNAEGSTCQWGTAFGLALWCAEGPFASRAGRPRENLISRPQVA